MKRWQTLAALFIVAFPVSTNALEQPDGTTIPTVPNGCSGGMPNGLASIFACVCEDPDVCNIGEPCVSETECDDGINSTCETTMWHIFNDNECIPSLMSGLDPQEEASITPQTFSPVCPLTFTVVSRGGAMFEDIFGWYNVTGKEPEPDDLHVMLGCDAETGDTAVLDVRSHPDYAGGEIGFFLVTPEEGTTRQCADKNCCASVDRALSGDGYIFYSENQFNPDYAGPNSYIHLLIYESHIWPQKFYFAWEDLYTGGDNNFTDFITSVSGVECAGGGVSCDTGHSGICEYGVTQCVGENLECIQLYESEDERCDGIDNDCDGSIDNSAICPEENFVCHNGSCVPHCELSDEFICSVGFICDEETGFCIEESCIDVDCESHQVCQGGHCVGGCDDVVCPFGRSCRLGSCIDPCEDVFCGDSQVCSEGICVNRCGECNGLICESPLECNSTTGTCTDPSCTEECPETTHCESGDCIDNCEGAICPGGQICEDGECIYPDDGDAGPDGGSGGDADADGDGDADADANGGASEITPSCSCRVTSQKSNYSFWVLFALIFGLFVVVIRSCRPAK